MMDEVASHASRMNNFNSAQQIKPPLYEDPTESEAD